MQLCLCTKDTPATHRSHLLPFHLHFITCHSPAPSPLGTTKPQQHWKCTRSLPGKMNLAHRSCHGLVSAVANEQWGIPPEKLAGTLNEVHIDRSRRWGGKKHHQSYFCNSKFPVLKKEEIVSALVPWFRFHPKWQLHPTGLHAHSPISGVRERVGRVKVSKPLGWDKGSLMG